MGSEIHGPLLILLREKTTGSLGHPKSIPCKHHWHAIVSDKEQEILTSHPPQQKTKCCRCGTLANKYMGNVDCGSKYNGFAVERQ